PRPPTRGPDSRKFTSRRNRGWQDDHGRGEEHEDAAQRPAIRERVGDGDIRDLELPFWTVTADLVSGREVVLGSGPLWQALDATSAIPGIFPPVAVGESLLIDGWVVNPIPVDVLHREG